MFQDLTISDRSGDEDIDEPEIRKPSRETLRMHGRRGGRVEFDLVFPAVGNESAHMSSSSRIASSRVSCLRREELTSLDDLIMASLVQIMFEWAVLRGRSIP